MRKFFWLSSVAIVAAVLAAAALTEYADNHPTSVLGRGMIRMALAWSGPNATRPATPAVDQAELPEAGDNLDRVAVIDIGPESDDTILQDLKTICELAREPELIAVAPKTVDGEVTAPATEPVDEFTPRPMPLVREVSEERDTLEGVVAGHGPIGQVATSETSVLPNPRVLHSNVEIEIVGERTAGESCCPCGVLGGILDCFGCWLSGFFGSGSVEVEITNAPLPVPPPPPLPMAMQQFPPFGYPPTQAGHQFQQPQYWQACPLDQQMMLMMSWPHGLPGNFCERIGIDFEGQAPFVTRTYEAAGQPPMAVVPVTTIQPNGQQVTCYVHVYAPSPMGAQVGCQPGAYCPPPPPLMQAQFAPPPCCPQAATPPRMTTPWGFDVYRPQPHPPVMPAQVRQWPAGVPHPIPTGSFTGCLQAGGPGFPCAPCEPDHVIAAPYRVTPPMMQAACAPCCAESKCAKALAKNVSIEFDAKPLSVAIDEFRELAGVNVVIDRPALEDAGIDIDQTVTLKLKDVPARVGLKWMLNHCRLVFKVEDDLVVVTTKIACAQEACAPCAPPFAIPVPPPTPLYPLPPMDMLVPRPAMPPSFGVVPMPPPMSRCPCPPAAVKVACCCEKDSSAKCCCAQACCKDSAAGKCCCESACCQDCVAAKCCCDQATCTCASSGKCCCAKACSAANVICAPRMQVALSDGTILEVHIKMMKGPHGCVQPACCEPPAKVQATPAQRHRGDLPPAEIPDDLPPPNHEDDSLSSNEPAGWHRIWFIESTRERTHGCPESVCPYTGSAGRSYGELRFEPVDPGYDLETLATLACQAALCWPF